ncbi:MAG TPA: beta-galactosidase [Candidatus Methylacidiphilales bacterium]
MLKKYPFDRIAYGGDYNPEQWPESVWPEDVRLMREAGVNLVSLGIFSWARLEPEPGRYDFGWLDRIVSLLHENGVAICLATATASPPPWFSRLHPESLPVNEQGVRLEIGSRQHYSPSSRAYREAAVRLCGKIAERCARHPAVVMWHLDNEYSCHVPLSYDAESAAAFRRWLQVRYRTLEALNDAWGTAFWSQRYSDWEEIEPPRQTPTFVNPAQALDFSRFGSDAWRELCRAELAAVRAFNPALPVTTNFMGNLSKPIDQFSWSQDLDLCAWDCYPDPSQPEAMPAFAAAGHDLTRSLRGGQPFFLMEQVTTQVNWRQLNALKPPGLMRAQSWQAVGRGADAVMFFQWRASRSGAEKFHGGMVPHAGTDGSRVWSEVCGLGAELAACAEITGSRVQADAAILFDWANWWAVELPAKPRTLSYPEVLLQYYRAFYRQNIPVDFVPPSGDFSKYRILVAPLLYLLEEGPAGNLRRFVREGGRLIVTWFSGIVDGNERVGLGGYPALLRDVLGVRVTEWQPLAPGFENTVKVAGRPDAVPCDFWADLLETQGAEVVGTFGKDFFAGRPAITRNAFGSGQAWYLATRFDDGYTAELIRDICAEAKVSPLLAAPQGVEVSCRKKGEDEWWFIVNHTDASRQIDLKGREGVDLLKNIDVSGTFALEGYGVRVMRMKKQRTGRKAALS